MRDLQHPGDSLTYLGLIAALCLPVTSTPKQPPASDITETVASLLEKHRHSLAGIRDVSLQLEMTRTNYIGDKQYGEPSQEIWKWAKSQGLERVRFGNPSVRDDSGRQRELADFFVHNGMMDILLNWDPRHPQKITPFDQGTVRASVVPYAREVPGKDVPRQLLMSFSVDGAGEERRTLWELCRESPKSTLIGMAPVNGHNCWHLKVEYPAFHTRAADGYYFDIYLDPSEEHLVRRAIEHVPSGASDVDGQVESPPADIIRTVTQFAKLPDGTRFPVTIEMIADFHTSDARHTVMLGKVNKLFINQPLGDDAFAFAFPENVLVAYSATNPAEGRRKVVLWSKDNRPDREIHSLDELPGYQEELARSITNDKKTRVVNRNDDQAKAIAIGLLIAVLALIYCAVRNRPEKG